MGDADQFAVSQFYAQALLLAVIEDHLNSGSGELGVERFCQLTLPGAFLDVHRNQGHLERGNRFRPDDAPVVVVLFNGGGHHAGHADAVTAHGHHHGLAIFIQHGGAQCFGVLGAELEDMPHLDAAFDAQGAGAIGAGITVDHITQVGDLWQGHVPFPVDVEVVFAIFIGAGTEVAHHSHAAIRNHGDRQAHRAQ